MAIFGFGKKSEGGLMDTIRCDEKDFLIWKWRPAGQAVNSTHKENAIRTGSSISIRPGQAAVFLYQQREGEYDVIKGPYNDIIKTENLPVLSSIIGTAYAGGTPFQAEIYYFNLAKNLEIPFTIPYFRIIPAEPEYKAYNIEVAVKGALAFEVSSQKEYIKYLFEAWGGNDTSLEELEQQLKSILTQEIKQIVANAAKDTGIFVMHFNSLIGEMGPYILARLQNKIANRFGVLATDVIVSDIRYDEESESYQDLKRITEKQAHLFNLENEKNALLSYQIQRETMRTDSDIRNQSAKRMAQIQLDNQEDMMARMREESQFAQHQQTLTAAQQAQLMNQAAANRAEMASEAALHRANLASETANIGAHQINVQGEVMKAGMNSLGQMGTVNLGGGSGMNPAGMMTGMAMGAAMAGQMGQMINNMGDVISQQQVQQSQTPPPPPIPQSVSYYVSINGQQFGPYDMNSMSQIVSSGQVNQQTLVWCTGMQNWAPAGTIPALSTLFNSQSNGSVPPPIPNKQ